MLAAAMPIPFDRIRQLPAGDTMGAEIRRIREGVFGWTQQALADMLGTTTRTIQRWENGHGGVALVTAYELLRCWEHERQAVAATGRRRRK